MGRYKYLLRQIARLSQATAARWINAIYDDLRRRVIPIVFSSITGVFVWLFYDYLEPGSFSFFCALAWLILIFGLIWLRSYVGAILALLALIAIIPTTFFNASYYIASDQFRMRYRSVDGVEYVEFPARAPFLRWFSSRQNTELIEVAPCDGQTVASARLPLLPYAPIRIERDLLLSPFTFRRLPSLKLERLESGIYIANGSMYVQGSEKKHSVSIEFGLPSTAAVPVTLFFPRSTKCIVNGVPLLPILEELPWDHNNTNSLIRAAVRSSWLRKLYPDQALSLEQARDLQMNVADSDDYKALFDFLFYSIAYHTFSGNVFSEVRAKIGNKLCVIADGRADVFTGAFAALPEQFLNLIVNELGSKYQLAYPACHMSNDMFEAFQSLVGDREEIPAFVTFRRCLDTSDSVAKCLGQDDTPVQPGKGCQSLLCGTMPRSYALQEPLIASYDEKFEDFVALNDGKTVAIRTLVPVDCPKLRDVFEESQFLNWWLTQANLITKAPASCSSADWNHKIADSKALIKNAISCGNKLGLGEVPKLEDATRSIDSFYDFRCNPQVNADRLSDGVAGLVQLADGLEPTISKLRAYAEFLGHQPLDAVIDAFEMMRKSKDAACGAWSTRQCINEYQAKGNFSELASRLNSIIDWNIFSGDQRDMVRRLTNLDNTVIDMAICDLLQDGEFATRTGYSRDEYCDSHELHAYRLFGSSDLGHSLRRPDGGDDTQRNYYYRSNKTSREYLIEFPIGDRAKSP